MKKAAYYGAFAFGFFLMGLILFGPTCTGAGAQIGLPAPPLSLERLGGGNVDVHDMVGKVVLLNYWATWCDPCVAEVPEIEKLHRHYEGKDFTVLAVNIDDRKEPVEEFARKHNLTFPILLDTGGNVARSWGTVMFPETYLIDKKGNVAHKVVGMIDYDDIVKRVDLLLAR